MITQVQSTVLFTVDAVTQAIQQKEWLRHRQGFDWMLEYMSTKRRKDLFAGFLTAKEVDVCGLVCLWESQGKNGREEWNRSGNPE